MTGQDLVNAARAYVGTPWHHAGRVRGVGIDCVGLLICAATDLGYPIGNPVNYTRDEEIDRMLAELGRYCEGPLTGPDWRAGDVLCFRFRLMPNHCGIYTEDTGGEAGMIHAYNSGVRRVVEHRLDADWRKRVLCRYRLRGLDPPAAARVAGAD